MKIVEVWTFQTVWDTKNIPTLCMASEWPGMVFIQTGGVLAGSAGYFLTWAGYRLDIGGVSQLLVPNFPFSFI